MNVRMQQGSSIFSSIFALNPEKEKNTYPQKLKKARAGGNNCIFRNCLFSTRITVRMMSVGYTICLRDV